MFYGFVCPPMVDLESLASKRFRVGVPPYCKVMATKRLTPASEIAAFEGCDQRHEVRLCRLPYLELIADFVAGSIAADDEGVFRVVRGVRNNKLRLECGRSSC